MVAITRRIVVCDVCRNIEAPVVPFRAAFGAGRLRTYALCDTHGAPVKELLDGLGAGDVSGPVRATRQVTLGQIESVKASRAPAKRRGAPPVPPTGFGKAL